MAWQGRAGRGEAWRGKARQGFFKRNTMKCIILKPLNLKDYGFEDDFSDPEGNEANYVRPIRIDEKYGKCTGGGKVLSGFGKELNYAVGELDELFIKRLNGKRNKKNSW